MTKRPNCYRLLDSLVAEMMLTQGQKCLVDVDMLPLLSQFRWHAKLFSRRWYAATNVVITRRKITTLLMHTLIMGKEENKEVDHINHNGLDNRKANLRLVSHSDNLRNPERDPNKVIRQLREG